MTALNSLWLPVPTDLTLLPDDIHVWRINLDVPEPQLQNLVATLSSDELTRRSPIPFSGASAAFHRRSRYPEEYIG